jgi:prepilin-type N-terminal cleavage/methylation domain-containing protein
VSAQTARPAARLGRASADVGVRDDVRARGFSLVELLVAASLAATLLAASWGWVWTTARAARATDARAQVATADAFAARSLRADMARCVRLATPSEGVCGPATLALALRAARDGTTEVVTVAWDARRGVVWRKASGSYLAEGVTGFSVRYFDRNGEEEAPVSGALGPAARARVRRVVVEWSDAGGRTVVSEDLP